MFKNISFKKKLILFILPVVVLGLLGVSVIAYIENRNLSDSISTFKLK